MQPAPPPLHTFNLSACTLLRQSLLKFITPQRRRGVGVGCGKLQNLHIPLSPFLINISRFSVNFLRFDCGIGLLRRALLISRYLLTEHQKNTFSHFPFFFFYIPLALLIIKLGGVGGRFGDSSCMKPICPQQLTGINLQSQNSPYLVTKYLVLLIIIIT